MHFLSTKDVSKLLNISGPTIRKLAESRLIPGATRIGKLWRFRKDVLMGWIEERTNSAPSQLIR